MSKIQIFIEPEKLLNIINELELEALKAAHSIARQEFKVIQRYLALHADPDVLIHAQKVELALKEIVLREPALPRIELIPEHPEPVLLVYNNEVLQEPLNHYWRNLILQATASIQKNIPSVGRLEALDDKTQYGTCFAIAANLVLTNYHVASQFCSSRGVLTKPVLIDFIEEKHRDPEERYEIERAVTLSPDPDFAILKVRLENSKPLAPLKLRNAPLSISRNQEIDAFSFPVYVIGYPTQSSPYDPDRNEALENRIFKGIFGVKRFCPGSLKQIQSETNPPYDDICLCCNYTSLNGSSGSPVFDFETGDVIGLHYAGESNRQENLSIPIWMIRSPINQAIHDFASPS